MSSVLALILGMLAKAVVDSFRYQQKLEPKIQAVREVAITANRISRDLETVTSNWVANRSYCYYDLAGNLTDSSSGSRPTAPDPLPDPTAGFVPAKRDQPLSMYCSKPAGLPAPWEHMAGRTNIVYFLEPYPDPADPDYPNNLGTIYRHSHMSDVPNPADAIGSLPPLPDVYEGKVLAKNVRSFEFTVRDTAHNPYPTTAPSAPVKEVEFRIAPGKQGASLSYVTVLPPPPPEPLPAP